MEAVLEAVLRAETVQPSSYPRGKLTLSPLSVALKMAWFLSLTSPWSNEREEMGEVDKVRERRLQSTEGAAVDGLRLPSSRHAPPSRGGRPQGRGTESQCPPHAVWQWQRTAAAVACGAHRAWAVDSHARRAFGEGVSRVAHTRWQGQRQQRRRDRAAFGDDANARRLT